jgi:signal recognition particle subunit SEC65
MRRRRCFRKLKKDIEAIKREIEEIDKAIYELRISVKIIGELDQRHNLIISEDETWPEAMERQGKINALTARKRELEKLLRDED